jgi:predicted nuclease of predicted toxin-antitoxin system
VRFLADMGVSMSVVQYLRTEGHDAVHLRELGLQQALDGDVYALATRDRRVILTFDLDFAEIAATAGSALPSVVIFRLNDTRVGRLIERLAIALRNSATSLSAGAIVVVDDSRIRIKELPFER